MANWIKKGRVFHPQKYSNGSWLQEFAQAPSVIVHDDFVRVYFSTRPSPNTGQYVSYSAFVDLDRNDLFKVIQVAEEPILKLGSLGMFDEFGTYPASVIRDSGDKFRCYYAGWTRCDSVPFNVSIGVAESQDGGVTFDKLGNGPVLSYSLDEPFVLSGPKIRRFADQWVLWYIAGKEWIIVGNKPEPIYRIRMATSEDGLNWIKQNRDLIPSRVTDEAQASPDVIKIDNTYHMFFCYRYGANYRGKQFGYRIGYASSKDMFNWERNDDLAGIGVSEAGWDSQMISYPHVFELDGNIYMFYLGNSVGKEGFGLAQLEKGTL